MKKVFTILLVNIVLGNYFLNAQNMQKAISNLEKQTQAKILINKSTGTPYFISFEKKKITKLKGGSTKEKAIDFLKNHKSIYAINSIDKSLVFDKTKKDSYGFEHVNFQQQHKGVPIFDGILRFHFDKNKNLTAINGNFVPEIQLSATPKLSKEDANLKAIAAIRSQNLNKSKIPLTINKNELLFYQKGLVKGYRGPIYLVYKVEVWNKTDVREYVFIDANKGQVVEQFTGMPHALDRVIYENSTSNTKWREGYAFPGSLDKWQKNEVEASGHVYYFFKNAFGYISYDGADAQMKTINNNPNIQCPNATWNGVTANYCTGTAADDVIAHEWGHAYTEYTNNLIYAWQSGAMNEGFSDIWGETIDLINNYEDQGEDDSTRSGCSSSDRWRVGEDATAFGGAIRDMWNPNCNNDPGKVSDSNYWCNEGDSGGVHINSGVVNHAYALLVDGGNYNGQQINGIGLTKSAHIFWQAQSTYLTATSDFAILANALEASATDLLGVNLQGLSTTASPAGASGQMITQDDINQLNKVLLATELRTPPTQCNFTPLLTPIASLCDAATSSAIFSENWESGIGNWTVEELPSNSSTWTPRNWTIESSLPQGRTGNAIFATDPIIGDCSTNLENGIIRLQSPLITMNNNTEGDFEMSFDHYIATEKDWDGGNIKYSFNGINWTLVPGTAFSANPYNLSLKTSFEGNDNPLEGKEAFSGSDGGSLLGSWGTSTINLTSLGVTANSSIQFRWEMGTDGCNGSVGWYIDDIKIYNCSQTLSVDSFKELANDITLYPNPSNGKFFLEKKTNIKLTRMQLMDITGKILKTIDLSDMQLQKEINIEDLSNGVYFITVIDNSNKKGVLRLLKK